MEGFVVSGSNNTAEISGSLNISGSTYQIGNNTLVGNTTLSGSIIISGSENPSVPTIQIFGDTQHTGVVLISMYPVLQMIYILVKMVKGIVIQQDFVG